MPRESSRKFKNNKLTIMNFRMIIVKIIGKQYRKDELQENSMLIRKWFVVQCKMKKEFSEKHYDISENNDIENQ